MSVSEERWIVKDCQMPSKQTEPRWWHGRWAHLDTLSKSEIYIEAHPMIVTGLSNCEQKVNFIMGTQGETDWEDEYSTIAQKGEVGFLDFEDEKCRQTSDQVEEGPLIISYPFPSINGRPQSALVGETSADIITIKNTTSESIELWSIRIYASDPEDSFILSVMKPPASDDDEEAVNRFVGLTSLENMVVMPGQTLTVWLSCKPKEIGLHKSIVHIDAEDKIERLAFLLVEDKVSQGLFSLRPYTKKFPRERQFQLNQYVHGSRPPHLTAQGPKFKLPQFLIPNDIREMIESKQIPDVIFKGLNIGNYSKYFSTLIVMEEIHLEEAMRSHDMVCVKMKRRGGHFLSLEVPGLAERRPSLVYGDYIFAQLATDEPDNDTRPYQGYIHRVEADEVFLKFDRSLHLRHHDNDLYNVRFTYNRLNMRRLYHAVETAEKLGPHLLFPSQSRGRRVIRTKKLIPLSPNLNREQAQSVEKIFGCKGAPPYLIFGPPGTGKTVTLVEAMLQLYTSPRWAKILFCAASNSAADYVLEKLINTDQFGVRANEILRLNAMSRPYEDVNPDMLRFCYFEDEVFKCPPLRILQQYNIVVSTYMSASMLYSEGIRKGHFSHIFLDEAGQVSEPETMVPISNFCARETVIVLAGDPMQLGPVIYSRHADYYGLGRSYMERLFDFQFYGREDDNYVTKLIRNYRCHPAILELPSKLFYRDELIACKEDNGLLDYDSMGLLNSSFPVWFIGIQGCDEQEGNNPSWFNRTEASKVVDTIMKLRMNTDLGEADIGVITPYRQQVLKLRKALESLEMENVKVGSVEQFQGQEKEVIIISTVRSTLKHNNFDRAHSLGFLSSPRRFNVAITRAKSLLVIIGNPYIIAKDEYWDMLLRYCVDNGSYQGCSLPHPQRRDYTIQQYTYGEGDMPDQYSSELQLPNEVSDTYQSFNEVGYDENDQGQCSNLAERDESVSRQYQNEAEGSGVPEQYSNESERNESGSHQPPYEAEPSSSIVQGSQPRSKPSSTGGGSAAHHPARAPAAKKIQWKGIDIVPTGWH